MHLSRQKTSLYKSSLNLQANGQRQTLQVHFPPNSILVRIMYIMLNEIYDDINTFGAAIEPPSRVMTAS